MTLQLTKPISMADIEAEFEAPPGTPLSAFVRGGAFVPDTTPNVGVPTAKPIAMTDLLGAANIQEETIELSAENLGTGRVGFIGGQGGSVNPTDLFGQAIQEIFIDNNPDLDITVIGLVAQDFWHQVTITGVNFAGIVFLSANTDFFSQPGGNTTRWRFEDLVPPQDFVIGETYTCDFTDGPV